MVPRMTRGYNNHSLLTVEDKFFVVGHATAGCELFDNACKKFVAINKPLDICCSKSVAIGNKIVMFQKLCSRVVCYDVDKDEWSEESCEVTKNLEGFSCMKIPC